MILVYLQNNLLPQFRIFSMVFIYFFTNTAYPEIFKLGTLKELIFTWLKFQDFKQFSQKSRNLILTKITKI